MAYKINVGDKLPRFAACDYDGREYVSSMLTGGPLVIYFYPKDDTPGCTKEACSFRDTMIPLKKLRALVIGISPDGQDSHKKFTTKYSINFPLLCDENLNICRAFDVLKEKEVDGKKTASIERTTFVIDPFGYINWIERPVSVEGHAQRVIEAVTKIAT